MPRCKIRQSGNPAISNGQPVNQEFRAAELAARQSYGKLLAILAARSRDIALAEDALADAFRKALETWPVSGVPSSPDAWLLTVARNRLTDVQRRSARFPVEDDIPPLQQETPHQPETLPDERLGLLLVCAHPAIDRDLHTPLMLQTVLGIHAHQIAKLFLVSPAALSKRLVRAKTKIRDAGISFEIPDAGALADRCGTVFEAIYALHALDWLDPADGMGEEALYLADLMARLLPGSAEAFGLSSLIAFSHSRRMARIEDGVLVPTLEQDTGLWDDTLIAYGQRQLRTAGTFKHPGRFQLEAAVEAVHIARKTSGKQDWPALNKLYLALLKIAPSAGALVAQAVVTSVLHGETEGLRQLDMLEEKIGSGFQPLWAARADMQSKAGKPMEAAESYRKAISLATDAPAIRFLRARLEQLPLK